MPATESNLELTRKALEIHIRALQSELEHWESELAKLQIQINTERSKSGENSGELGKSSAMA